MNPPANEANRLLTVTERPFNAETPLSALHQQPTPAGQFFVRCNFDIPVIDAAQWSVRVDGHVAAPATLTLKELQSLPYREVTATMECAGNGRKRMRPVPEGTAWDLGAVSTGVFGGTPLAGVLEACGIRGDGIEVVCEGADAGAVDETGRVVRFVRSLPREKALHPDTLLAWALNGEALAPEHGYPLRVFVPGWYGVASVKWLRRLSVVSEPFTGHFQTDRYVYRGHPDYAPEAPVTQMHVRALITQPADGDVVTAPLQGRPGDSAHSEVTGAITVRGVAWSGFGHIVAVEVSDDEGVSWSPASLSSPASPYAATAWHYDWAPRGESAVTLMARARDSRGGTQPLQPVWNELGYGNNVVQRVRVTVAR